MGEFTKSRLTIDIYPDISKRSTKLLAELVRQVADQIESQSNLDRHTGPVVELTGIGDNVGRWTWTPHKIRW